MRGSSTAEDPEMTELSKDWDRVEDRVWSAVVGRVWGRVADLVRDRVSDQVEGRAVRGPRVNSVSSN